MNTNPYRKPKLYPRTEISGPRDHLTIGGLKAILDRADERTDIIISLVDSGRDQISVTHDPEGPVVHIVVHTHDGELRLRKPDFTKETTFAEEIGFDAPTGNDEVRK